MSANEEFIGYLYSCYDSASNLPMAYQQIDIHALDYLLSRFRPENMLELGSGLGLNVAYASGQGILAEGIELESNLVQKAHSILLDCDEKNYLKAPCQIHELSFFPGEYVQSCRDGKSRASKYLQHRHIRGFEHVSLVGSTPDVLEKIDFQNYNLIYAWPWVAGKPFVLDMLSQYCKENTLFAIPALDEEMCNYFDIEIIDTKGTISVAHSRTSRI